MSRCCPVCETTDVAVVQQGVEGGKVHGKAADVSVLRCAACDLDFLDTWDDAPRAFAFYAHDDYVYVPDVDDAVAAGTFDEYAYYLDRVRPFLNAKTRVLDIGCGDGRFLRMVRPHAGTVIGTEMTPALVSRLRAEGFEIWDRALEQMPATQPFDVVCLHAVLEHVPNVLAFLLDLKRFLHEGSQLFLTVPHGLDPLTSYYDVEEYRRFYYREYHFYYFTARSLERLLDRAGYRAECSAAMMASMTNHFHWLHRREKQRGRGEFTAVTLPAPVRRATAPSGRAFTDILGEVDDFYRRRLVEAGIGDLLHCRATPVADRRGARG